MKIIGTGNYDNISQGNTVSVDIDGGRFYGYLGPSFRKLAYYDQNKERYEELLEYMNEIQVMKQLLSLEGKYVKEYYDVCLREVWLSTLLKEMMNRFGDSIILVSHEGVNEVSPRRLFADYLELKMGIYIPEIAVYEDGSVEKINPKRFTKSLAKVSKGSK